jgi:hypothetical protein
VIAGSVQQITKVNLTNEAPGTGLVITPTTLTKPATAAKEGSKSGGGVEEFGHFAHLTLIKMQRSLSIGNWRVPSTLEWVTAAKTENLDIYG